MSIKISCIRVIEVILRRAPAFRPRIGEPVTLYDQMRAIVVAMQLLPRARRVGAALIASTILAIALVVIVVSAIKAATPLLRSALSPGPTQLAPAPDPQLVAAPVRSNRPSATPAASSAAPATTHATAPALPVSSSAAYSETQEVTASSQPAGSPPVLDLVQTASAAGEYVIKLLDAESTEAASTWCALASALDTAACTQHLSTRWTTTSTSSAHADFAQMTIGSPVAVTSGYVVPVQYGQSHESVTVLWDGQRWSLSDTEYQNALANGGLFVSILGIINLNVGGDLLGSS